MDLVSSRPSSITWSSRRSRRIRMSAPPKPRCGRRMSCILAQRTSFFPHRPGEFQRPIAPRTPSAPSPIPPVSRSSNPYYNLYTAQLTRELPARCLRRDSPPGRDRQGASREQPLPARSHLLDLEQQCGGDRRSGGLAARTDRGDERLLAAATSVDRHRTAPAGARHRQRIGCSRASSRRRRKPRKRCRRCKNNWGIRAMP